MKPRAVRCSRLPSVVLSLLASAPGARFASSASPTQAPSEARTAQAPRPTRAQRRERLAAECAAAAQWELHETAHYFLVVQKPRSEARRSSKPRSTSEHEAFVAELKARAESLRRSLRAVFPREDGDPNPIESAPNVLRVCRDRDAYYSYGGSGGTTGYWNPNAGEFVIYDAASDERALVAEQRSNTTWRALNSNLYFAYVAEFGDPPPPIWFLDGHASYFAGFEFVDGEHTASPDRTLKRSDAQSTPLLSVSTFVERFSTRAGSAEREYFSERHAPLAWALVWSARQATRASDGSTPSWSGALDRWWSNWVRTRDAAAANVAAFEGVDWRQLDEACARALK